MGEGHCFACMVLEWKRADGHLVQVCPRCRCAHSAGVPTAVYRDLGASGERSAFCLSAVSLQWITSMHTVPHAVALLWDLMGAPSEPASCQSDTRPLAWEDTAAGFSSLHQAAIPPGLSHHTCLGSSLLGCLLKGSSSQHSESRRLPSAP